MPTLVLTFPGRRYHATPWGQHVNEGLVEWPPSPWRVIRALLSVGYTSLGWTGSLASPMDSQPPPTARSLVAKLASALPLYALPPAIATHSRHYMPIGGIHDGREQTTLVFDTWAQIDAGELAIRWDVELDADECALLRDLAGKLGYLGRSESWVEARLSEGLPERLFDCRPGAGTPPPGPGWEQVSLLAPVADADYDDWLAAARSTALAGLPEDAKGKVSAALAKKRAAAVAAFPRDMFACLHADSTFLRAHGWGQPPGSRRVLYWRRADALRAQSLDAPARQVAERPTMALFELSTASGNPHALPILARSLPQGEMLHRQVVGARTRIAGAGHSPVLTGCDETGRALSGQHRHGHVLSLDLNADGHVDHLMIWAPDGFDAADLQAIKATRATFIRGGVEPLRLGWVGCGERVDMTSLSHPLGEAMKRVVGESRTWVSVTPFVAPRYLKARGANTLEGQVRSELSSRGIAAPVEVIFLDPREDNRARQQRHHVRVRRFGNAPPVNAAFTLQLVFAEPVAGPLCLGYGSHFGLGRFECTAIS